MRYEMSVRLQSVTLWLMLVACCCLIGLGRAADAQTSPFNSGWTLQSEMSNLDFQSVKKQTIVEVSSFAAMEGTIDEFGQVQVKILLDSIDTSVDLRNVRMRFLFFETFKFPEAVISTLLDPGVLADLEKLRRKQVRVDYAMTLHGVTKSFETELTVTLLGDDLVSVASRVPVIVNVADFNLMKGLEKLEDAASVDIIPSTTVSFDFVFARNTATTTSQTTPVVDAPVKPVALEVDGNFDLEACTGRFEILSRSGEIYFTSGSSRLEDKSAPLLNALAAIVLRCPGMVIEAGGHTDSVGDAAYNMRLSQARARSVVKYLLDQGLSRDMIESKGYGETEPIATNDTKKGRWKNRRIGFKVL